MVSNNLEINNLHASVILDDETEKGILNGVDLTIKPGEIHAIMGPNGSGKSTLAYSLAGHPKYNITSGSISLAGTDLTNETPDVRSRAGLFLSMQSPAEVDGISMINFLRTARQAHNNETGEKLVLTSFMKEVGQAYSDLEIDDSFKSRSVNVGFSGGEKKRHEILQMKLLKPKFIILDEVDSGLDVDALRIISREVLSYAKENNAGLLIITHYNRILEEITPDFVHVFAEGKIKKSGDKEFAKELEKTGYDNWVNN
ncbi:MAG: Fe-S cluster assembly ATPase SufC [Bifidobacteriaceae bacterium]|jgi:Fe-S cluster assembly ATP-binding protein|nr:Fe-S cluster assembly ATPase SufC [Bifidobacteriaceae bacterium]